MNYKNKPEEFDYLLRAAFLDALNLLDDPEKWVKTADTLIQKCNEMITDHSEFDVNGLWDYLVGC